MNAYARADMLLEQALKLVKDIKKHNKDDYGLLKSALGHIAAARADLESDLK